MSDARLLPDNAESIQKKRESFNQLEWSNLDHDDYAKGLQNEETTQRMKIKEDAKFLAVGVISSMHMIIFFIFCFRDSLIGEKFGVILFVAPISSITLITISVLFGAFRRFKEDDMDKGANIGASAVSKVTRHSFQD